MHDTRVQGVIWSATTKALLVTVAPPLVATSRYSPAADTARLGKVATPPEVYAVPPESVPVPEIVWSVRSTSVPSGTAAPPAGGVIVT